MFTIIFNVFYQKFYPKYLRESIFCILDEYFKMYTNNQKNYLELFKKWRMQIISFIKIFIMYSSITD